jgi:hypothetical protein
VLGEAGVVLDVECGEGQFTDEAAGGDPGVVGRLWPAAQLGVGLDLAPALGDALVVGQDCSAARKVRIVSGFRGPTAGRWSTLCQFSVGDEGDGDGLAGELPGETVGGAAGQERGGDVGVDDDEAHARLARREA